MNVAVLGTGGVGQTLAGKLAALGHDVMVGTRNVAATLARNTPDAMGAPPFATWHKQHPEVTLVTFAQAAQQGEMVINATSGAASLAALTAAGAGSLAGKVLMDVANPLDFSRGMPPSLTVANTDSLGEQIQRAFPEARVVKALNTMTAAVMVNPQMVAGGDHNVFICGDDAAAKSAVTALLRDGFGWREVLDVGGITSSRGLEMEVIFWVTLMGALGTPMFNFKVAR
jgi:predicted dinucleotide-binding enzyme